jgi:hypothetical protein
MLGKLFKYISYITFVIIVSGCSGVQTFQSNLKPGETAIIAAGWKHNFSRDNITVTITPSQGAPIVLMPGDPAVRAVINMYPDPLSSLIVSEETDQDLTPFARTYGMSVNFLTGGDKDMWQTTVFIDLPQTLSTGLANIEISNAEGDTAVSTVNVIEGSGTPELFDAELNGPLTPVQMAVLERIEHYELNFSGPQLPYAIEVILDHDLDADNGGAGKAYVVNPRGDVKNVLWSDNGALLKVLLTPTHDQPLNDFKHFKFYVSGGITNLSVNSVNAVDENGNPVLDITASLIAGK